MQCYIYRCEKKKGTYLFLTNKDKFDMLPAQLINLLGQLTFTFDFDLHPNQPLMQSDAKQVRAALKKSGYYLQLAPEKIFDNKPKESSFILNK